MFVFMWCLAYIYLYLCRKSMFFVTFSAWIKNKYARHHINTNIYATCIRNIPYMHMLSCFVLFMQYAAGIIKFIMRCVACSFFLCKYLHFYFNLCNSLHVYNIYASNLMINYIYETPCINIFIHAEKPRSALPA